MSEIFLSYASEDKAFAEKLATALEAEGWSVWWDQEIPPGGTWHDVIGAALEEAACVIVLWSARSIKSQFVRDEARRGQKRNALVPVLIEEMEPPLGFGEIQAANFTGWDGDTSGVAFQRLVRGVSLIAGPPKAAKKEITEPPAGAEEKKEQAPKEEPPHREEPPQEPSVLAAHSRRRTYLAVAAALVIVIGGAVVYYFGTDPPEPIEVPIEQSIRKELVEKEPVEGESTEQIREAQGLLNRLGYEVGPPTGQMSTRTISAIKRFESEQGLINTGEVDAPLIEKLKVELARRDETAWQAAEEADTKEAFEAYRNAWPEGTHVFEVDVHIPRARARQADAADEDAWQAAENAGTKEAFETYRNDWPEGAHVGEVDAEIAKIRARQAEAELGRAEARAWDEAKKTGTIEGYETYRRTWPEGSHVAETDAEIAKIKIRVERAEAEKRQAAREEAERKAAAEERAKAEADEAAWQKALKVGTEEIFEAYRRAWPKGAHVGEVDAEIKMIKAAQALLERKRAALEERAWAETKSKNTADAILAYIRAFPNGKYLGEAQFGLAIKYSLGDGVPKSDVEAHKWIRLAAEGGYAFGQLVLGGMYEEGDGVPQSNAEADKWIHRAADQGSALALHKIGSNYENGLFGHPRDLVEALKWYILAAAKATGRQSGFYEKIANTLKRKIMPAQITEAEQRAAEWLEAHKKD